VDLDDSERASVVVKHGAGKLELTGISEPGKLVSGNFATGLDAGSGTWSGGCADQ